MTQGPAVMTVTGITVPSGSNTWVMPTFLPMSPSIILSSLTERLDLDVHTRGQVELHQRVDGLGRRLEDVQEALVGSDLELLPRLLVDVRGAEAAELVAHGVQRDRPHDPRAGPPRRVHDLGRGLVEDAVVVGLEADPDFLVQHGGSDYWMISVQVPAPTVRPPSRMANR